MKDKTGKRLTLKEIVRKVLVRFFNYLLDFELMFLRWVGFVPSHIFRKTIYKVSGIKIGKGSSVHMWANFFKPWNIVIGKDSIIGDHAFLDGRDKIKIGDHVDIASSVMIYNSEHDLTSNNFVARNETVEIGDYVFVGPRVTILPGVKIGKGAVVAAGAVVTKDVDSFDIVAGIPASKIGERKNKDPKYVLGRARLFQ